MSIVPNTIRATQSAFLRRFILLITVAAVAILIVGAHPVTHWSQGTSHSHLTKLACVGGSVTPCGG